ncbi:LysR family transcriptional regulator [Marinomonas algarum]|uniref:LysR family transcriptional regulator n=1 Tax=Marinomonas algarum TaxID=2883105 RepID=A0A9X1LBJ5_9GAMM|nr:LysR family transcriptional regulator [Marinomonas algarum]MCB5160919.1 LysR family transcriptional regulator [Marinomonas algarum]
MEIVSLKTFKAVVDEGGVKNASAALNTVPSNVSMRIQKLENELDIKLFTLQGRKLELTANGSLLYHYAQQILQLEHQARTAILTNKGRSELKIGTTETFAAVHLPYTLKQLKKTHPHIAAKIHTATSANLISAVLSNKIDCAFVGIQVTHNNLVSLPIIEEPLVLVEPADQDYNPVMIVRDIGCGYRQAALDWQQTAGRGSEEVMTMGSVEGVLGCIAAGLGYTVIGEGMLKNSRYEASLISQPATQHQAPFKISLIYQDNNPLVEDILAIADLFQT